MNDIKKTYAQPTVAVLGSVAEKTQAGSVSPSDDGKTRDTALPLPS